MKLGFRTLLVVVLGSVLIIGCNSAGKVPTKDQGNGPTVISSSKPALKIPDRFEGPDGKRNFAVQAVNDGYYVEAAKLLKETIEERPTASAYRALGTAQYNLERADDAIAAWTKAMENDPALSGEMLNNIGNALRDQKKYDFALDSYKKALKVESTRWSAAVNMADLLRDQGRLADAVTVLETALPANANVAEVQMLLTTYKNELNASKGHS